MTLFIRATPRPRCGFFFFVPLAVLGQIAFASLAEAEPESHRFAFGVEYMVPGLAKTYTATGATWAKPQPEGWNWASIEPDPPRAGKHRYEWSWTDRLIREYQEAGFRNFHIYTQVRNPWASSKPLSPVGSPSFPPKPEYLADYANYLRSLVERYDGDGKDDMPGLLYPVRYWEIEAEWGTFWPGTVAEYLNLLRIAHRTVKEADPKAQVILQGLLLMGLFDGDPDPRELERRLAHPVWGAAARKLLTDIRELLKHPDLDLFDVVEFHSLGDWTDILGTTKFLREEMKKQGYQKPIWAGDVNFSLNPMIWWGKPFYPYAPHQKDAILKWLEALKQVRHPDHDRAVRWFRAEQASFTAKKIVCSMGEGLAGINMGNLEDWPQFTIVPSITGTTAFCGLIDTRGFAPTDKKMPWGTAPRIPGEPRPVYWTMKMLIEKLGAYTSTDRLSLGRGVYAYRFRAPDPPSHKPASTIVLWYEDGKGQLPEDPEPRITVSIAAEAAYARLTRIITKIGEKKSTEAPLAVHNARINVTVDKTPLLIEEGAE